MTVKQLPRVLMGAREAVAHQAGMLDVHGMIEQKREELAKYVYTHGDLAWEKERAAKEAFAAMVRWAAFDAMKPAKPQ